MIYILVSILKKATQGNWWVFDTVVNDSKMVSFINCQLVFNS